MHFQCKVVSSVSRSGVCWNARDSMASGRKEQISKTDIRKVHMIIKLGISSFPYYTTYNFVSFERVYTSIIV